MLACSIVVLGRFHSSKPTPFPAMLVGSSSVCITNPSSSGFVSSEPVKSKDWPCGDPNGPFKIKSFPAFLFTTPDSQFSESSASKARKSYSNSTKLSCSPN
ncbi:hypothetical protein ACFX1X_005807 [Malus domestica]